ncbi:TetR/AcrR family transcriptional regulator [Nonomuraea fastidiosa]|uniref:TetR/AcrR family transcriptional regulator n=1 Tax=Nonomuraea TaxID=83681 RepID=UPI0034453B9E
MARRTGLREQKKQATRKALREAALRLALERGPDNVRVDDIAEAAGVSPRTYNNYFASREQAIVAAVTAERESRVAEAVAARPPSVRLADAVIDAIVEQYTDPGEEHAAALLMITTRPALREAFVDAPASMELPLAAAIAARLAARREGGEAADAARDSGADRDDAGSDDDDREHTARVLAAAVAAAVRVAIDRWVGRPGAASASGLVVPSGSLPGLLRASLAPLVPALDAAER